MARAVTQLCALCLGAPGAEGFPSGRCGVERTSVGLVCRLVDTVEICNAFICLRDLRCAKPTYCDEDDDDDIIIIIIIIISFLKAFLKRVPVDQIAEQYEPNRTHIQYINNTSIIEHT